MISHVKEVFFLHDLNIYFQTLLVPHNLTSPSLAGMLSPKTSLMNMGLLIYPAGVEYLLKASRSLLNSSSETVAKRKEKKLLLLN